MAVATIHALTNLIPVAFAGRFFFGESKAVTHSPSHDAIDWGSRSSRLTLIIFLTASAIPS